MAEPTVIRLDEPPNLTPLLAKVARGALPLPEYYEARLKLIEAYDRAGFVSYHVAEHHATPLGMAPSPVQGLALELFSRKASAVATNVPGPQQPLFMAGCEVREMMFWVPQTGSIGLGISILSYNGRVHFGLIADAKLIPDPDAVIRRFGSEFDKLLYLALMGNWDHRLDARGATALVPTAIPAGS